MLQGFRKHLSHLPPFLTSSFWSLIHFLSLCFFLLVIILSVFSSVIFFRFSPPPPRIYPYRSPCRANACCSLKSTICVSTATDGTMVTKIIDWKRHGRTWSRTNSQYCTIPRYDLKDSERPQTSVKLVYDRRSSRSSEYKLQA